MVNKKIEALTPEQIAKMPAYTKRGLSIGLSTARITEADKIEIEKAIKVLYENAGLNPPARIHYTSSPQAALNYIQNELKSTESKKEIYQNMVWGCHDISWLIFYEFFRKEVGIINCDKIEPLLKLATLCGWISAYDTDVVIQERPNFISFDDQKRLHCETGPAITYEDGFSVYAWHGVRIPAEWITHRSELSPQTALKWENMEQRRAACEIVGWARILRELNASVINSDEDPMVGTLVEVEIPEVGKERFLKVLCGTGREFAIPVPPTCHTALEANAWTFNIDGDTLRKLEVRT